MKNSFFFFQKLGRLHIGCFKDMNSTENSIIIEENEVTGRFLAWLKEIQKRDRI